jgi:hypothetical protein
MANNGDKVQVQETETQVKESCARNLVPHRHACLCTAGLGYRSSYMGHF